MISTVIEYSEEHARVVAEFDAITPANKSGSYWNNEEPRIKELKTFIKNHLLRAQNYTCAYCRQKIQVSHNGAWDTDHIISKDEHPQFIFNPLNLCISCKDCNTTKSNKNVLTNRNRRTLPTNSTDYLIVHPYLDEYSDHISVMHDSMFFLPKTDKGKFTVETCGLLRFVYLYQTPENIPLKTKEIIGKIHHALMNTADAFEENFLMSQLNNLTKKCLDKSAKDMLETILERPNV